MFANIHCEIVSVWIWMDGRKQLFAILQKFCKEEIHIAQLCRHYTLQLVLTTKEMQIKGQTLPVWRPYRLSSLYIGQSLSIFCSEYSLRIFDRKRDCVSVCKPGIGFLTICKGDVFHLILYASEVRSLNLRTCSDNSGWAVDRLVVI